MTFKQLNKRYSMVRRALENAYEWSWKFQFSGYESEHQELRAAINDLYEAIGKLDMALAKPMGRKLQEELRK